jgi:hypothetical protein
MMRSVKISLMVLLLLPCCQAKPLEEVRSRRQEMGVMKKSRAFTQPLKSPRKFSSGNSKVGNNNSFLFGNLTSYMMYQNMVKSKQKDLTKLMPSAESMSMSFVMRN